MQQLAHETKRDRFNFGEGLTALLAREGLSMLICAGTSFSIEMRALK